MMSASVAPSCDRSYIRLYVHCYDRKFIQLARPSDSLHDLLSLIRIKHSKLYGDVTPDAVSLRCQDGFDLDADDVVADVFSDRDHVHVSGTPSPPPLVLPNDLLGDLNNGAEAGGRPVAGKDPVSSDKTKPFEDTSSFTPMTSLPACMALSTTMTGKKLRKRRSSSPPPAVDDDATASPSLSKKSKKTNQTVVAIAGHDWPAADVELATCKMCGATMSKLKLKGHIRSHNNVVCPHCHRKFVNELTRDVHIKKHHAPVAAAGHVEDIE